MKRAFTARVDSEILDAASEICPGSLNSLVEDLLREYVLANRPSLEILQAREEELKNELKKVQEDIRLAKERICGTKYTKKSEIMPKNAENDIEIVKNAINRQLQNSSIKAIIESPYFRAYQKRLGWSGEHVIELILSVATEEKKQEYMMSCDIMNP